MNWDHSFYRNGAQTGLCIHKQCFHSELHDKRKWQILRMNTDWYLKIPLVQTRHKRKAWSDVSWVTLLVFIQSLWLTCYSSNPFWSCWIHARFLVNLAIWISWSAEYCVYQGTYSINTTTCTLTSTAATSSCHILYICPNFSDCVNLCYSHHSVGKSIANQHSWTFSSHIRGTMEAVLPETSSPCMQHINISSKGEERQKLR